MPAPAALQSSPVSRKPEVVRARILDAAEAEFVAAGFDGASTNRILERFGGSKPTMFRHFPTKKALFEAVVERIARRWHDQFEDTPIEDGDPATWLAGFTLRVLRWVLSDETIFLGRLGVTEAGRFPELAAIYRRNAAEPIEAALAQRFAAWTRTGQLACADPARDARAYVDLAVSGLVSQRLYGFDVPRHEAALAEHVAHVSGLFLDGRRPR